MIRPAIVLVLLLSAAIMMRGVANDWRKSPVAPAENAGKKAASAGEPAPIPQAPGKGLQPVVPSVLPDLKSHYLFNPERMLAGGADVQPAVESQSSVEDNGNKLGIMASIGEVTYAGSIIADNFSRAIILYPAAKSKPQAQPAVSKSSKSKPPPAAASKAGGEEHAQLEVGDVLDGYEVAKILPDKLVFTKGDESVEKLLYDPEKKRQAPPPRPLAAPGGGAPRPQQIPVGGAAPGTAAPPAPAAPGTPGTVPSPAATPPPPPVTPPPAVKQPATPAAADQKANPIRQMVISRQPAAAPDTSKVIRQSPVGQGPGAIIPILPPGAGEATEQHPSDTPPPQGGN